MGSVIQDSRVHGDRVHGSTDPGAMQRALGSVPAQRRSLVRDVAGFVLGEHLIDLLRRRWLFGTVVIALSLPGLFYAKKNEFLHGCYSLARSKLVRDLGAPAVLTLARHVESACRRDDSEASARIEALIEAKLTPMFEKQLDALKQVTGSMQQALAMTAAENARLKETIDRLVIDAPPAVRAKLREGDTAAGVDYFIRRAAAKEEKDKGEAARALVFAATLELFKDTRKAIEDLTRAIGIDPSNGDALALRAMLLQRTGDTAGAERDLGALAELARRTGRQDWNGNALAKLGILSYLRGDLDRAHARFAEALSIETALGRKAGMAEGHTNVGVVALARGDLRAAEGSLVTALEITQDLDTTTADTERHQSNATAAVLTNLGRLFSAEGELDRAQRMHAKARTLHEQSRNRPGLAEDFLHLGNIAYLKAELPEAEAMYQRALVIADEMQDREQQAVLLGNLGTIASRREDPARAEALFRRSLALNERLGRRLGIAHQNANLGMAAEAQGDVEAACRHRRLALDLYGQLGQQASVKSMRRWVETCEARQAAPAVAAQPATPVPAASAPQNRSQRADRAATKAAPAAPAAPQPTRTRAAVGGP